MSAIKTPEVNMAKPKHPVYDFFKRGADLLFCFVIFPAFLIVFLFVCLLLKLQDGGPVFYLAKRVGLNGKPFYMYKFRTMKPNAERLEDFLTPEEISAFKKEYKLENDPRITKIGKILRKTSIDELPQILNIMKNEMSLVGPRPIVEEESAFYGTDKPTLLSVKPGLTGYWQAYARNEVGYADGRRQQMELYYVGNRSFFLDLNILFITVKRVFSRKGVL